MSDIEKEYCLRCQIDTLNGKRGGLLIANCDRFRIMKHSPSRMYAFTEQGVAMLSAVLKSDIAIRESIRMRQVHEDHLRHLPRPLHHRRSEGNLLENAPKKRTCVSQGRFATGKPEGRTSVCGASLKDACCLTFAAAKMGAEVILGLLDLIRKATSGRREYGKSTKAIARPKEVE